MELADAAPRRLRLWAEFGILFVAAPLALALVLPPSAMFTVLGLATIAGMVLLHRTPGFDWADLLRGRVPWGAVAGIALASAAVSAAAVLLMFPSQFLALPLRVPQLWLMILLLYPFLSALPQEVVFRPLFFRRYGGLFPSGRVALVVNAAVFSLAHAMYGHPLVLAMTFAGGLAFAWAYEHRGSFLGAVLMHAVAGQVIFTSGLGRLFYSGAVN